MSCGSTCRCIFNRRETGLPISILIFEKTLDMKRSFFPLIWGIIGFFGLMGLASCNLGSSSEEASSSEETQNPETSSEWYRDQPLEIPSSLSGVHQTEEHRLYFVKGGDTLWETPMEPAFTLSQARGTITGTATGLHFNFHRPDFNGTLQYGFIPYEDYRYPQPVYFKKPAAIEGGQAEIPIAEVLSGKYDMVGWEEKQAGTIGYRIQGEDGTIYYDGCVSFRGTGPFEVDTTLVEGPLLYQPGAHEITVAFETNWACTAAVGIDGVLYGGPRDTTHHEIRITDLKPNTRYEYTVYYGNNQQTYTLLTAPEIGSRAPFTFAYASDSRNGYGGGERNVHGANHYIMKKIGALAARENVRFLQFTGDLIDGYLTDRGEMDLQYANWKKAIGPFAHHLPIYATPGNHESFMFWFQNADRSEVAIIEQFPYATHSGSAVFAEHFSNPDNPLLHSEGPLDENEGYHRFPPYAETAYSYTYGNVGVICMNSDYWYSPTLEAVPETGGGLHGYIMDNQLAWVRQELEMMERDPNIDHVFLTEHTPFFPNGGHIDDDMWYNGNNEPRPVVGGQPVELGIIQRRDELLEAGVNGSSKLRAILTGDEHNYCKTLIGPETPIYPEGWEGERITLERSIYQINNGAAGAPYYGQESTPWTPYTSGFSTQNALVLFDVDGDDITVRVINPDTLEEIESYPL